MSVIPLASQGGYKNPLKQPDTLLEPLGHWQDFPARGVGAGCQADSYLKGSQKALGSNLAEGPSCAVPALDGEWSVCAASSIKKTCRKKKGKGLDKVFQLVSGC